MEKRIPLKKETHNKLVEQTKAEGKTADELASEIIPEKTTAEKGEPAKNERKGKSGEKKSEPAE